MADHITGRSGTGLSLAVRVASALAGCLGSKASQDMSAMGHKRTLRWPGHGRPLYPRERTCPASKSMSAKCQKQTFLSGTHRRGGY